MTETAGDLGVHHFLERLVWRERSRLRIDVADLERPNDLELRIARLSSGSSAR